MYAYCRKFIKYKKVQRRKIKLKWLLFAFIKITWWLLACSPQTWRAQLCQPAILAWAVSFPSQHPFLLSDCAQQCSTDTMNTGKQSDWIGHKTMHSE